MKQKEQDKIKKIISIVLLIGWCLLIFYFSNQVGDASRQSSSHVIDLINKILNINLYNYEYSIYIVRKLAHMFLYFILYLLSLNVCKCYKINKGYLYSFLFCFLYAISDEIHQLFIFERSFGIIDILIDAFGSICGYFVCKIIYRIKRGLYEGKNIK